MAEQLLDGAQVRAVGKQMRGERVAQRVRMQVPVHVGEPRVTFHELADGFAGQTPSAMIQEHGLGAGLGARMLEKLGAQRQVSFQRLLRFRTVRNHAFLAPFAQDAKHLSRAVEVSDSEPDEFADPKS